MTDKRNCPTCDTRGIAGDGRQCWTCEGRGWVSERAVGRTVDLDPATLEAIRTVEPGPSCPR
jgi:hypothetical protein